MTSTFEENVQNNVYADLTEEDRDEIYTMERVFLNSYVESKNSMELEEWLPYELSKHLPDKTNDEIREISIEIIDSLKTTEEKKLSQKNAIASGRGKDSWFSSELKKATSYMSTEQASDFLRNLDRAVTEANVAMHKTITTKSSGYVLPNKNPNLDGFIAEQYQVNTFNMASVAKGQSVRAEVPPLNQGQTYSKNGFDVIIKDAAGNRKHQYQMKYGSTDENTINMLRKGNYNNQQFVVPAEQQEAVQNAFPTKTVSSAIKCGDISGKSLTKAEAKEMQHKAQMGENINVNWNEYVVKDIALGISKSAATATLQGAAIGTLSSVASKIYNNEPIKGEEVIKDALVTGADFGIKAATAGVLKVISEKSENPIIPKGTDSSVYSGIAFVAIENAKVLNKVAKEELTVQEGLDEMEQTTYSSIAGIAGSKLVGKIGEKIGTLIGTAFGPVGSVVGQIVGYSAGAAFGNLVAKGVQKVRQKAFETIKNVGNNIFNGVKTFVNNAVALFGF